MWGTFMDIIAVIAFVLALLQFFRIDAFAIWDLFKQHRSTILKYADITWALIWFGMLLSVAYVWGQTGWNIALAIIGWIMLYSLITSILSTLRDFGVGGRGVVRAIYITIVIGTLLTIGGFWWSSWPSGFNWPNELNTATIVTIIFFLIFGGLGIYFWIKSIW
jgi:hypothetical protein